MIVPSTLPVRFVHDCGGIAHQLAEGPPYLVALFEGRTPTPEDIQWKQRYHCNRCGALFAVFEDLHIIVPVRELLRRAS